MLDVVLFQLNDVQMKTILDPYLLLKNSLFLKSKEECALYTRQICTPHFKYIGGDLSLLPKYKELRAVYKNEENRPISNLLLFCGENGFNTIRCRLLVDPGKDLFVCQNMEYVVSFAKEIKSLGFEFFLVIHYSDQFADSSLQKKPFEWNDLLLDELQQKVYDYTFNVLTILKENDVSPDLIQIGNGLQNGFLWEDGFLHEDYSANNKEWTRFLLLLKSAEKAIRKVLNHQVNIIIGIDSLQDKERALEFFSRLMIGNIDFDTIGLSYRPYTDGNISGILDLIDNLLCLNGAKDILFTEVSIPYDSMGIPIGHREDLEFEPSIMGQKGALYNMISQIAHIPQVSGFIYWYPEETLVSEKNPFHLNYAGLFNNKSGQVMPAFSVFKLINRRCR